MSVEAAAGFNQPPPTTGELLDAAVMLHFTAGVSGQPDRFAGYTTFVEPNWVRVQRNFTPERHVAVDVYERDGVWYMAEEVQHPADGLQVFNGIVRDTVTYPLADGMSSMHTRETGILSADGQLLDRHEELPEVGDPLDDDTRAHLMNSILCITGERPIVVPRQNQAPQGGARGWFRGWGRRLGLIE